MSDGLLEYVDEPDAADALKWAVEWRRRASDPIEPMGVDFCRRQASMAERAFRQRGDRGTPIYRWDSRTGTLQLPVPA